MLLKKLCRIARICLPLLVLVLLGGCDQTSSEHEISIGVIAGPEAHLMEVARVRAKNCYGLDVNIVTFTDYNLPNAALNDGSIDANMFQHRPFLDAVSKARDYNLVAVGETFVYPMAIYSHAVKQLADLPSGASVAIPNDPSNEARALLLLQQAKLITLKQGVTVLATPFDIVSNPKHLKFIALDAAQLARSLDDAAIAVINTNFAIPAGLRPANALLAEDGSSLYDNVIVTRAADQDHLAIKQLVASLQSPEVLAAAKRIFGDSAVAAWDTHQAILPCVSDARLS